MPKKRRPFLATSPAPDPAGVPLSPARTLTEAHAITHALGERIKELRCMYGLTRLIEQRGRALDELLAQAVELLPPAWQYPEHACARITLSGRCYTTANFRATRYRQAAAIRVTGQPPGESQALGPIVCSCYQVAEISIRAAIADGCTDSEQLGRALRCGTNCGSCVPELNRLLREACGVERANAG